MLPWTDGGSVVQFTSMIGISRGLLSITKRAVEKVQECILEELRRDRVAIDESRAVFRPSGIDVIWKPYALQFL